MVSYFAVVTYRFTCFLRSILERLSHLIIVVWFQLRQRSNNKQLNIFVSSKIIKNIERLDVMFNETLKKPGGFS